MVKVGDSVFWTVRGKRYAGKVVALNPKNAPGARYKIRAWNGENYYPVVRVTKIKK